MPDYRTMFDRDYLGAWDLPRDVNVQIRKVEAKKLNNGKKSALKPILYFEGKEKGMACNKTNGKTIAAMYGNDVDKWLGKWITIYPTTTSFGSETVECIRVRPMIPKSKGGQAPSSAPSEPESAVGEEPATEVE